MRGRRITVVVVVSSSVSAEAHSLHSLFDILNSIMVITSSSLMIPVLLLLLLVMIVAAAVIVVRLSLLLLRVSSGGGPGTSVVHLLRSP